MVREHRRERRELELFRPEIPTAPTPRPIPAPTPVPIPLPTPVPTPGPSAVDPAYAGPVGQVFRPRRAFRREIDHSKFSWLCCECSAHFRKPKLSGVLSDSRTAGCPADRRVQRANRMCFCDNIANSAISKKKKKVRGFACFCGSKHAPSSYVEFRFSVSMKLYTTKNTKMTTVFLNAHFNHQEAAHASSALAV